jgi:hypothetical protein
MATEYAQNLNTSAATHGLLLDGARRSAIDRNRRLARLFRTADASQAAA